MEEKVLKLLRGRRGHFLLESGHHGDLRLELESLCLQPRLVPKVAVELAKTISNLSVDVVCGPLVEGAFVAMMVALHLDVQFVYAERFARSTENGLFLRGIGCRIRFGRSCKESALRSIMM